MAKSDEIMQILYFRLGCYLAFKLQLGSVYLLFVLLFIETFHFAKIATASFTGNIFAKAKSDSLVLSVISVVCLSEP